MTIENTELLAGRRMSETTVTQNATAQKIPENKLSSPVLTADPEMLLKMSESMTELLRMNPPMLANSLSTILRTEVEETTGEGTTEQKITNHTAKQVFLLAELTRLMGKSSENTILNNLNASIAQYEAIANSYVAVSSEYESLLDNLKELKEELSAAKEKSDKADTALIEAEEQLASLLAERETYEPGSDSYKSLTKKIEAQQTIVDDKTAEANDARLNFNTAATNALTQSRRVDSKLTELIEAHNLLPSTLYAVHTQTKDSAIGKYIELIATILNLIGKNNDATVENQRKLNDMIHAERLQQIENQAAEIKKKNNASGILKKILGVFGFVAGVVLGVIGIIAAVPSAGAGSGLAIAGIALAALSIGLVTADLIVNICTGFEKSATGMLMEKLTKALTQAFINKMLTQIDKLSRENNADNNEEIERLKNLTEKVLPMIASIVSTVIFLLPSIAMVICTAGGALGSTASALSSSVQKSVEIALKVSLIGTVTQILSNTGLNTAASIIQQQITKVIADMKLTQNDIEHVNQMTALLVEQLQKTSDQILDVNKTVLNVMKSRMDAVQYNLQNLRNTGLSA